MIKIKTLELFKNLFPDTTNFELNDFDLFIISRIIGLYTWEFDTPENRKEIFNKILNISTNIKQQHIQQERKKKLKNLKNK